MHNIKLNPMKLQPGSGTSIYNTRPGNGTHIENWHIPALRVTQESRAAEAESEAVMSPLISAAAGPWLTSPVEWSQGDGSTLETRRETLQRSHQLHRYTDTCRTFTPLNCSLQQLQSGTHQVQAVFHMVVWLSMVSMNAVALCRTQLILEGSPSVVG